MRESIQRLGAMDEFFGPDRLAEGLRGRIREMIMTLAEAELAEVLGARNYERNEERRGYRNGKRHRSISTGLGATVIELPRGPDQRGGSGQGMAERVDCALSAARSVGGSSCFGLLFKRSQRATYPRSACAATAWIAAIEERDFTGSGATRRVVFTVAPPVIGQRAGSISLS